MDSWTPNQVADWLSALSLGPVGDKVRASGVTGRQLAAMDDEALQHALGVSDMRHRVAVIRAVRKVQQAPVPTGGGPEFYAPMRPMKQSQQPAGGAVESYMPMRNSIVAHPSEDEYTTMDDANVPKRSSLYLPSSDEYTSMDDANVPGINGMPPVADAEGDYTDMTNANVPSLASIRGFDREPSDPFDRPPAPLPAAGLPRTSSSCSTQGMERAPQSRFPLLPETNASAADLMKEGAKLGGFLHKQGWNVKNWKARYIILRKGCIYYFASPQAARPKGCFSLGPYNVDKAPEVKRPFCFKLVPKHADGRQWLFSAQDDGMLDTWVSAIQTELDDYSTVRELPSTTQEADFSSDDEELYDQPYDDSLFKDVVQTPLKPDPAPVPARPVAAKPAVAATTYASPSNVPVATKKQTLVPLSGDITRCPWFLTNTTRSDIEQLVIPELSFLVRQKPGSTEKVLTVRHEGKFRHYKIFNVEGVGFSLGGDSNAFFSCELELVRFYQKSTLPRTAIKLGTPFK
eukprot:m.193014 g.193014  ORF g.193014 m.193014 type:complete len:516 (+) comp18281_c0_seq1:479-2026(+)